MNERPVCQSQLLLAGTILLAGPTLGAAPVIGQETASMTLPFLVQDGLRYIEQRRFREAINVLEEAWERDSSHPIVAEHLALAYLYEHIPPQAEALAKARKLMRFSLENDGRVSVFARHLHSRLRRAVSIDDQCSGRLVLSPAGLHYQTSLTEHSFSLDSQELESIDSPKNQQSGSAGVLTLRVKGGKRQRMRTGTLSRSEAEILLKLTREFLLGG